MNAFSYALHLAKMLQAEIVTLHMYEIPGQDYDAVFPFLYKHYDITDLGQFENYKSSVRSLNVIAARHHLEDIKLSHVLREGPVTDGILGLARSEKPDFIVMGTNGASEAARTLFGSVAERLINRAAVPVIVIPEGCSYKKIDSVLLLAKYSESEVKIMDTVIQTATRFKAHTDVLEVRKRHRNNEAKMLKIWQSQYAAADVTFHVKVNDEVEDTILKFITQNKTDLVVMTVTHKNIFEKLFFYSLSRNMAYHAVVPILSIPAAMADTTIIQGHK